MKFLERVMYREKHEIYYYDSRADFNSTELAEQLKALIKAELKNSKKTGIVILCIGTDCSTGDSLGPLIGYKLKAMGVHYPEVIGTLERPVHAVNLNGYVNYLKKNYPDHLVIAVDASVGHTDHIGYITMGRGSIRPGLGVSKELSEVGDIYITGIVGGIGNSDPVMLQSIHLSIVMRLADCISESIALVEKFWDKGAFV